MQALQEEMIVVLLDLLLYKAWLSELLLGDRHNFLHAVSPKVAGLHFRDGEKPRQCL